MTVKTAYQRKYLRAPFTQDVLYGDGGFVHKAKALNLSEGGILLSELGCIPADECISFMFQLPRYSLFKNFHLEDLRQVNREQLETSTIRFNAHMVRKPGNTPSATEGVFSPKVGFEIKEIAPIYQKYIYEYVDVFSSNLIYMQVLIDTLQSDQTNLPKLRLLSHILGYDQNDKVAYLRKVI
ncbi:MAG: hypothetical protein HON90_02255, partial [Halobacteriovoraceae bacterium]|nr:hypothetical protein [Halobacteriovoraceae bacterium]